MKKLLLTIASLALCGSSAFAQINIAGVGGVTIYTVATLPPGQPTGKLVTVKDGASAIDCSTGGGSTPSLCVYNGSSWVPPLNGGTFNPAAPGTTPGAASFTTVESTYYATSYTGADIGAQVNAAEAACTSNAGNQRCEIVIPSGEYTFTTQITVHELDEIECAAGSQSTLLHYNGTGTAFLVSGGGAAVRNCYIDMENASAVYGINLTGGTTFVDGISFQESGGGTSTILIGIHSNGNIIRQIEVYGTAGVGFECDNAIDSEMSNVRFYGNANNTTSQTLIIDSGCDGTMITDFTGGFSGLHGLLVRNTLTGGPPTWIFAKGFVSDVSTGGDGWLFDSTLGGSAYLGYVFDESWAAGAGMSDSSNTAVTAGANGIHISGGIGITITDSKIRSNAANGILIDNANAGTINISNNIINANNRQDTTAHGISVTASVAGLTIAGNTIGDITGDMSAYQDYGINISSTGITDLIIANNNLDNNVTGPISNATTSAYVQTGNTPTSVASTSTKASILPNTAPSAGQLPVGNAGGTAYAPVTMSGSCTMASTGAIRCSVAAAATWWDIDTTHGNSSAGAVNGDCDFWGFQTPVNISTGHVAVDVGATDTSASNYYDFAIYTAEGALVTHTGSFEPLGTSNTASIHAWVTTGSPQCTSLPCTLSANTRYYFAACANGSSLGGIASGNSSTPGAFQDVSAVNVVQSGMTDGLAPAKATMPSGVGTFTSTLGKYPNVTVY